MVIDPLPSLLDLGCLQKKIIYSSTIYNKWKFLVANLGGLQNHEFKGAPCASFW